MNEIANYDGGGPLEVWLRYARIAFRVRFDIHTFLLPSISLERERKHVLTFLSLLISFAPRVYRLIKWTEQTFPTNKNEELLPILEKCTVELQEDTKYQKDLQYLRVWIKYADACSDPSDVFKFLKANDIGQTHAL